jgi:hypothetical protein
MPAHSALSEDRSQQRIRHKRRWEKSAVVELNLDTLSGTKSKPQTKIGDPENEKSSAADTNQQREDSSSDRQPKTRARKGNRAGIN